MPPRQRDNNRNLGSVLKRLWTSATYATEYAGLAALLVAYLIVVLFVKPFHRMFYINDLHLMFPHAEVERVPVAMGIIYAGVIPMGILVSWLTLTRASVHKHHVTYVGFLSSLILTSFITDIIKNAVGRPRPDLISRCQPREGTQPNVLVDVDVCTETRQHRLHDGWRAFPSGHSSFSFAGLGFLSLWMSGQLGAFRHGGRDMARVLLCLTPLLGALLIAISRCEDYRHDEYDVTVGSLLGFSIAYCNYRRFWPEFRSDESHEPLPAPRSATHGYGRVGDEEEGGEVRGSE